MRFPVSMTYQSPNATSFGDISCRLVAPHWVAAGADLATIMVGLHSRNRAPRIAAARPKSRWRLVPGRYECRPLGGVIHETDLSRDLLRRSFRHPQVRGNGPRIRFLSSNESRAVYVTRMSDTTHAVGGYRLLLLGAVRCACSGLTQVLDQGFPARSEVLETPTF
jgi:hypothetical protein